MNQDKNNDLCEVLQVNQKKLPLKSVLAVKYLERRWVEKGCPREAQALQEFLDEAITFCPTVGYIYPKVFLLRLKELQRGKWSPTS
jgi:hypothetical protein